MADSPGKFKQLCDILKETENIPALNTNWNDITKVITDLVTYVKNKTYRFQVTKDVILQCKNVIEKSFLMDFNRGCSLRAHVFRLLRNCCVESRQNQEYIISVGLLPIVVKKLEYCLKHNYKSFTSDHNLHTGEVKEVIETSIQLLGNLVTGNEENQDIVWAKCYNKLFQEMMDCDFEQAKNYTCMVIYNCMRSKTRLEMITSPQGIFLTNSIIQMCCKNEKDVEWGIFILELFMELGYFSQLYDGLRDNHQRIFLLNLIEDRFKSNEQYDFWISWISVDNISYLAQILEDNITKILRSQISLDTEEMSCQIGLVTCLLRLLCFVTSFPEKYVELRNRISLLENTLVALRETSTAENKSYFSNVSQFPSAANEEHSLQPTYGFKKNLVQLIGNMCYQNRRNQDIVREMDCIPLLLDHCNVDDYNPYICQWAIFSLRNILENNQKNQEVINSLKKIGLAKNERLTEAGFLVKETENNRIKVESKKLKHNENVSVAAVQTFFGRADEDVL